MPKGIYPRPERKCPKCGGAPGIRSWNLKHRNYICPSCHTIKSKLKWRKKRAEKDTVLLSRYRRGAETQRQRNPIKVKARAVVSKAIKSGRLIKSETCSCGARGRIEGHHYLGYENPLDVMWLCVPCHRTIHRALAEKARKD